MSKAACFVVASLALVSVCLGQELGVAEVWGSNGGSELGLGAQSAVEVPAVQAFFENNGDVLVDFCLGWRHGIAVTSTGSVYSWGSGDNFALGDGGTTDRVVPSGVSFTGSPRISGCSCGNQWTVCYDDVGSLWAWGRGDSRQAGNNAENDQPVPFNFGNQPPNPVVEVSAGNDHGIALLNNNRVFTWGSALTGRLGRDAGGTSDGVPALVTLNGNVVDIAAGSGHTLVAMANGQVYGWGDSSNGEVFGFEDEITAPVLVQGALEGRTIVQVGAGVAHSICLSERGEVFAWGDSEFSQAGSAGGNVSTPTQISFPSLSAEVVVAVAAGDYHNMAVTDKGRVFMWGRGDQSQLGLGVGVTDDRAVPGVVALQHPDVGVLTSVLDLGRESSMVYHEPCLNMCSEAGVCERPGVCVCQFGAVGEDCGSLGLKPVEWAVAGIGIAVVVTLGYQARGSKKKSKKRSARRARERSESQARMSRQNSTVSAGSAAPAPGAPPPLVNQQSQAAVMQAKLAYLQAEQQAAAAKLAYAEQVSAGSGSQGSGSRGSVASGMPSVGSAQSATTMRSAGMVTLDSAQTIKPMSPAEILANKGIQRSGSVPTMPVGMVGPAGARLQRSNTATTNVSKSSKKSGSSGKLSKRSQQSGGSSLPPARARIEEERKKKEADRATQSTAEVDISKLARPIKMYTDGAVGDGITSVNAPFIPSMHFSDFGSDMMSMNTASTGITNATQMTGDRSTVAMKSKDYTQSMKGATPVNQLPPETREARRANSRFARNNRKKNKGNLEDLGADDIEVESDMYRNTTSTWNR